MLGLYFLLLILVSNAALFGLSALLAKPLSGGQRRRWILITLAMAFAVSFGPRVPGMVSDIAYRMSSDPVRSVSGIVRLQEGDRVGLDFDVPAVNRPGLNEQQPIFFQSSYTRTVALGLGVTEVRPDYELPKRYLLQTELLFDERTADPSNRPDVIVKVHGWESGAHYHVDVEVRKNNRILAKYRDRFRLRWPGMPTSESGWLPFAWAYLTQASILEPIAEAIYPGAQSRKYGPGMGPVTEFLSGVIAVQANPDPTPESVLTTTIEGGPELLRRNQGGRDSGTGGLSICGFNDDGLTGVLTYERNGLMRYRATMLSPPGMSFPHTLAAACVGSGIATLLASDTRPATQAIVVYDADLHIQCSMQFKLPGPEKPKAYIGSRLALYNVGGGFEI